MIYIIDFALLFLSVFVFLSVLKNAKKIKTKELSEISKLLLLFPMLFGGLAVTILLIYWFPAKLRMILGYDLTEYRSFFLLLLWLFLSPIVFFASRRIASERDS